MNRTDIIGNLTNEPELKATKSGKDVCTFNVAVNRYGSDTPDFFRVSAWDKLATSCKNYLHKGRKVFVSGVVSARAYTTQNGEAKASLELSAREVEFLSPKDGSASERPQEASESTHASAPAGMTPVETDDLPF